jgi:hypothetical protein
MRLRRFFTMEASIMTGLPRFASQPAKLLLTIAALAVPVMGAAPVFAQAAPAAGGAAQPAAAAPAVNPELKNAVENFWHFGKIARYDLASAEGQKIVAAGADPEAVLSAFEQVAAEHQDAQRMDDWLLRWQGIDAMRDVTSQVAKLVAEGYRARRSSPNFMHEQIERLNSGERGYGLAITRLRESGELAVPFLLEAMRDPARASQQPMLRRALRDLGRYALNPLVAATQMQDWGTLTVVVGVLGDLGYADAGPYVARLFESADTPATVKSAAAEALARLGAVRTSGGNASTMYYDVAERQYNGQSAITADSRYPMANIWYWEPAGLTRKQVPHEIFNDLMAMRETEYTLSLGGPRSDDAASLWLAANYRREADLPEGATDPTRGENQPPAHYYGVTAGPRILNAALARALRDRNSAVAFRAIRSLQEIAGQSNLFVDSSSRPLINAMSYPDRKVRFEAAFALAGALPQTSFDGQNRVVPLLAEAISQTGQPSVMVIAPSQDQVNQLVGDLKNEGYAAAGATSAEAAVNAAAALPAVDVLIVSEDLGQGNIDSLFLIARDSGKLAGAGRLILTKTNASEFEQRKVSDPMLVTSTANTAASLKPAIEEARTKAGALALDEAVATEYATRAAELMLKVGISRGQVFNLEPAKQALLGALSDKRPEIVKLAGQALALLNDADAQKALVATASDTATADDVKISLYKSLATSAKFFGNKLESSQVQTLESTVADATNLDVRSAAAEARGALNLPVDQAKALIVKQSKV